MGRKWRQQPIACQSCRRRKIRCSREFPCSNCTSRGIKCVQFYQSREPGEPDSAAVNNQPESASPFQVQQVQAVPHPLISLVSGGSVSVLFPNVDLQTRLDRLPDWTFDWHEQLGGASSSSGEGMEGAGPAGYQQVEQPFATNSSVPLAPYYRSPTPTLNQMKADGMWVEEKLICNELQMTLTSNPPTESFFDVSISFHLSPIRLIKKPYCVVQDASTSNSGIGARQMCIFIPLYPEACTIVNTFTSDWLAVSPTVHMSSLLLCIQTIYTCIQEQKPVSLADLLLYFGIIASVTHSASLDDDMSLLFDSHEEAISRCATWIDAAFAMSDEFKRRGLASLVCLQAQTILSKVSCYMEGSSVRNRTLSSHSIAMARELGIHRIDLPGEERSSAFQTEIEVEIARRVWWDNVALDWYIALFPGPQEGVYTVDPRQMAVNKPSNIAADFGDVKQTFFTNDQVEESDASYMIERIRLAEIGREYIDSCPISEPSSHEQKQKQERLHGFNLKLDELQRNLPSHLTLRKPGDPRDVPGPRTPSHVYQCINLNGLIYIVRCINHIRFLSFPRVVPRLSFPYQVSIQCAKDIIWMANVVKMDHPWILNRLKATSFIRALLLACATLLLDLCSGSEIHDLQSERPEMLEAWRLLGEMEEGSNLIDQFLGFASQMLRKYHVSESIISALNVEVASSGKKPSSTTMQDLTYTGGGPMGGEASNPPQGPADQPPRAGNQSWQTLDTDSDIRTMAWDNVLWGLETVLI
ncbi:hypothetical protein E4U30_006235 [Claviceps sp. LM220 group G6]|nr:hypothetical protein E4U30_006235 [Claviceps sp. LM220 group G6]KAG6110970.1 hypothetical protein E4U31_005080 [Claviceps sp. LM219 group G6]KAG6120314.1 hypothetical protein E4U14_003799 [Claviceps sp. LM454 group G7]